MKKSKDLNLKQKDNEILSLRDTIENQEAKMNQLLNDHVILRKQFEDKKIN